MPEGKLTTSVALCTYNGEKFLREQLDSLARQDRLPDEVIVGDDRSSDGTLAILEDFAARAPFPVRLAVNETNLGSTSNFERAVVRCAGDIVFLCDQDDVWHPEKISAMADLFENSPDTGMVFSDARLVGEDGQGLGQNLWEFTFRPGERKRSSEKQFYRTLLKRNVVTGATMAFRAKFTPDFRPIPTHLPNTIHDGWIALVVSACSRVVALDRCLIDYRQHPGQQLGVGNEEIVSGSTIERFSKTIGFLEKQQTFLDVLGDTVSSYPALDKADDVREAIAASRAEVSEYRTHLQQRIAMAEHRSGRLRKVADELKTGRYHRFSRGVLSSLKDALGR
jgi:glycosyltransferase involved in cell wall biosynthesis